MRRARGFTLLELMVVVSILGVVGATLVATAATIHREERHSAAYAQDLAELRRAVQYVERAVRTADAPGDLGFELVDRVLTHRGRPVARPIGTFEVEPLGDTLARVRIGLAPRSDAPNRREATLELVVQRRGREAPR